ncbi:twin-arginine translocation signal domain-containing protein (plasmid) [Rhizobium sp. RCAM05350]|nr:twin-arginine translocation signal domain-containing protein [Rhizobium sp. RCAM05350]
MPTTMPLNRRQFLTASAAAAAAITLRPGLSYAVEGDTLIIRGASDIEVLDPAFQNGLLEEEIGRCLFLSLNRLNDVRRNARLAALCRQDADAEVSDGNRIRIA